MKRRLIAKKPFEFSARVTLQLGRESISSSTVAISELIKNSYDADADDVFLDFHLRNKSVSTLIIRDSGNGMDADTLFSNWLKIGTDNKSLNGYSKKKNRVLTGAKGLGRLGIDRLCKKLVLYTKTEDMDTAIQLNIDWKKFEDSKLTLSDIEHEVFEVELPVKDKYGDIFIDKNSSGTRMILLGLKDEWDDKFLSILENELRLLISPFQAKNEFSIDLSALKGSSKTTKKLNSEKFLSAAKWKVKAEVDDEGAVSVVYINNEKKKATKQESIIWSDWIKGFGNKPSFGPVNFEFHYIPRDVTNLKKVDLSFRDWKSFMESNRGVRIYRDHFRVRPYGEPTGKGDWLDIGYRKASSPSGIAQAGGGWRIGPNQILGAITISRESNKLLEDQANREGIVENDAFFQLRAFIIKVIETFEILAHKDAAGDVNTDLSAELAVILNKSQMDSDKAIENLTSTVKIKRNRKKSKKKSLTNEQRVELKLQEVQKTQDKLKEAVTNYLSILESEKSTLVEQKDTLSNLASIGILTISFGHEVRQHAGQAITGASRVLKHLDKVDCPEEQLKKPVHFLNIVKNSTQYIDNFSKLALENIKPDKRKRKKTNVPDVFNYVQNMMAETLDKMGIKRKLITNGLGEEFYFVYSFEIDWESIAINFLTNSIWALEDIEREKREIEIEFTNNESELIINFRDSGVGLEKGSEESIFLPMHSSKRDHLGNSIGTGMGLAIVKTHIEEHMGGVVSAKACEKLGGADFKIVIPRMNKK